MKESDDGAESDAEDKKSKKKGKEEGSRSNHQRLQAIEMFAVLIKASEKDE